MEIERRFSLELRASGRKLEGYAAVFGIEARIGNFVEVIRPGAFRGSLKGGNDIIALVDHDPSKLLARTKSGTLRLSEDSKGLQFEIQVPGTQLGNDILELAQRGDLGGMSFGFPSPGKDGERWQGQKRELINLDLREISVVSSWPAYEGTIIKARSKMPVRLAQALRFMETV